MRNYWSEKGAPPPTGMARRHLREKVLEMSTRQHLKRAETNSAYFTLLCLINAASRK